MEDWKGGGGGPTTGGRVRDWISPHRNINRGYRKLIVWQDAMKESNAAYRAGRED